MAHSAAYWRKRSALLMYDRMEGAELVSADIASLYQHAYNEVASRMGKIFSTYEKAFGLTDKEAMKLLNALSDPGDMKALKKALTKLNNPAAQEVLAQLNAPAYAARINRLQELMTQVESINRQLYSQDLAKQTRWYTGLASDSYYRSVYDIQQEVGFQFSFKHIDKDLIDKVMHSAWSGETFSETLWHNVNGVTREVRKQLSWGLITGKTERQISKEIANKYAVGAFESRRLVRTESCYLSNEMQFESYEACGADRYQYVATLDSKTDEECGELDRKIFYVKDKQPGVNCPPMHPFCRCTTKIYIDQNTRSDMKRRARNPVTGRNEIVSANISYKQWAEQNGLTKSKPKKKSQGK